MSSAPDGSREGAPFLACGMFSLSGRIEHLNNFPTVQVGVGDGLELWPSGIDDVEDEGETELARLRARPREGRGDW